MAKYTRMHVFYNERRTDAAYLFTFHEDEPEEEEIWVPKSLVPEISEVDNDGNVEAVIAKWFLKENDIPYESGIDDVDDVWRDVNNGN